MACYKHAAWISLLAGAIVLGHSPPAQAKQHGAFANGLAQAGKCCCQENGAGKAAHGPGKRGEDKPAQGKKQGGEAGGQGQKGGMKAGHNKGPGAAPGGNKAVGHKEGGAQGNAKKGGPGFRAGLQNAGWCCHDQAGKGGRGAPGGQIGKKHDAGGAKNAPQGKAGGARVAGAGKSGPKGNNGVGNGIDPAPPGNPRLNDGRGTGPRNPGNKGGPGGKLGGRGGMMAKARK